MPSFGEHIEDFTRALAESAKTSEPLHVELTPPGHVDFGWVTTFVHCPRCKAEGPVERWQQTYPEEPLDCPVCGFSYQPALTHSSERGLFAETVRCPACQAVHRVRDFPDDVIQVLEDRHNFDAFERRARLAPAYRGILSAAPRPRRQDQAAFPGGARVA